MATYWPISGIAIQMSYSKLAFLKARDLFFSSIFGHLLGIFTDLVKDKQTLQFVMNTLIKIREMLDETDGEDRYLSATVLIVRVYADFRSS